MSAIRGTIRDGKVVFDTPPDWPEGKQVFVVDPAEPPEAEDQLPDDEDGSPEAIEQRLALMDRVQPWMTPEELAAWDEARAEDKAFQLSQWEKWGRQIEEQLP